VKLGLQISRFHWAGGPPVLAQTLAQIGTKADDAGFSSIWLMDHFFQLASLGKVEDEMLEAYTTLGFLAAHTRRARLGTLVSGVHHRYPGVLIKQATTLDVLSGGRAWLGLGAGWYERESKGLGIPFPPLRQRFERLEETLRIAHHVWSGERSAFVGKHFQLNEPISSPAPLSQPRPPILVGGGGERKTLRLVARYADACNLFARYGPRDLSRKLDKLRGYCAEEGRPYEAVEKTALTQWNVSRQSPQQIVDQLGELREIGFDTVIGSLTGSDKLTPIEIIERDVLPAAAQL
jgi:F420-dependent oxidoreductase-like protein